MQREGKSRGADGRRMRKQGCPEWSIHSPRESLSAATTHTHASFQNRCEFMKCVARRVDFPLYAVATGPCRMETEAHTKRRREGSLSV